MDPKVSIKKPSKLADNEDLQKYTKEALIARIKSLSAHNQQLRNIIAKSSSKEQSVRREVKPFDFERCNFRHIALKLFYFGWHYKGYVVQEDTAETIEHHLFEALITARLIKDRQSSNYHRCGRTDKGVSSFGQVISIDVRTNLSKEVSNDFSKEINYCKLLNKILPNNIQCVAWSPVDESFSARFNCETRTYKYYFPKGNLNIEKMQAASEKLLGVHDFRNFCKMDVGNGVTEFTRNILELTVEKASENSTDETYAMYVMNLRAKAFLWHQIRCIMGVLFLIGQNKEDPSVVEELLNVEKNPRKPEYSMASETPLNLFYCEYDGLNWQYNDEVLDKVIEKLNTTWTFHAIKKQMVKDMITSLKGESLQIKGEKTEEENCLSSILLQKPSPKIYLPLLERKTCGSLEDKIKHFTKRKRIEIANNDTK
ncbi:hypothetical protein JTB14_014031 [Gonioctena quinquepunctata]|nr:hypothetical protein JTB14_014031 [Gonioctena quinquepunctata]